ncbi:MAG: hypothetical protein ACE5GG_00685 [Candidatus Omnitrophota bacterium]
MDSIKEKLSDLKNNFENKQVSYSKQLIADVDVERIISTFKACPRGGSDSNFILNIKTIKFSNNLLENSRAILAKKILRLGRDCGIMDSQRFRWQRCLMGLTR